MLRREVTSTLRRLTVAAVGQPAPVVAAQASSSRYPLLAHDTPLHYPASRYASSSAAASSSSSATQSLEDAENCSVSTEVPEPDGSSTAKKPRKRRVPMTGPRAAALAARQEAAAKAAVQQETEARRRKIIDATPPPPYKLRVSARATGPPHLPMHARPAEEQERVPVEHYWSHLPDPALWHRSTLNKDKPGFLGRHRYFLSNRKSVKELVDSIGLDDISQQNGGEKVTVVEAFAGAGTITSELLKRREVGKVVALEQETTYLPWLEGLVNDPTVADTDGVSAKDKLKVLDRTGFNWVTYEMMDEQGMLSHLKPVDDKTTKEATSLAPLVFIAQLPNSVHGDQLLAQLAAAASVGQWLFKYGKVKMVFICPEIVTKRFLATAGDMSRSRLGTVVSILHEAKVLLSHEPHFLPQPNHVFPPNVGPGKRTLAVTAIPNEQYGSAQPFADLCAFELVPRDARILAWRKARGVQEDAEDVAAARLSQDVPGLMGDEYESLEYILRNLFVARTRDVQSTLEKTYPGSSSILKKLTPEAVEASAARNGLKLVPVAGETRVNDLTNAQWVSLAQIFERWPFRPPHLFERANEGAGFSEREKFKYKSKAKVDTATTMGLEEDEVE